jgi:hypothetical protein
VSPPADRVESENERRKCGHAANCQRYGAHPSRGFADPHGDAAVAARDCHDGAQQLARTDRQIRGEQCVTTSKQLQAFMAIAPRNHPMRKEASLTREQHDLTGLSSGRWPHAQDVPSADCWQHARTGNAQAHLMARVERLRDQFAAGASTATATALEGQESFLFLAH